MKHKDEYMEDIEELSHDKHTNLKGEVANLPIDEELFPDELDDDGLIDILGAE